MIIPMVSAAALWLFIFMPGLGMLDHYLAALFGPMNNNWLGRSNSALFALALTQKYEPDKAGALMESITGRAAPGGKTAKKAAKLKGKESGRMERARSSAYNAVLPGGGR